MPDTHDNRDERIWAFVHGELDADEQSRWEAELENDAALAAEVRDVECLHREWRELAALSARSEEDLVSDALEDFEQEQAAGAPPREAGGPKEKPASWWTFPRFLVVAAAACVLVAAGIQFAFQAPLSWSVQVAALEYRGTDPADGPRWTERELNALARQVREAVNTAYLESTDRDRPPWRLSLDVAELPDGALWVKIAVSAPDRDGVTSSWEVVLDDDAARTPDTETFANRVVRDLGRGRRASP